MAWKDFLLVIAVFPPTIVQTCIVHLIRHSMDFASWKDRKPIAAELKAIYRATGLLTWPAGRWRISTPASGAASIRHSAQSWRRNWEHVILFFAFPVAVWHHLHHESTNP